MRKCLVLTMMERKVAEREDVEFCTRVTNDARRRKKAGKGEFRGVEGEKHRNYCYERSVSDEN